MKTIIVTLLAFISFTGFAQDHADAKKLLTEVKQKLETYKTQQIEFSQTISMPKEDGGFRDMKKTGKISIQGDLYRLEMEEFTLLRLEKEVYTIYPDDREVVVSKIKPGEETRVMSPKSLLKEFDSGYSYKMGGTETVNGRKITYVLLKPKASNEIREVMIGIDTEKKQLVSFKQFGLNDVITTLEVTNYKVNPSLPESLMKFDESQYKGFTIIRE